MVKYFYKVWQAGIFKITIAKLNGTKFSIRVSMEWGWE